MRSLYLFKKKIIIIILIFLPIILYFIDFSKFNYKYINKDLIEFKYDNLKYDFNKKIYLFFDKLTTQNKIKEITKAEIKKKLYYNEFKLSDQKIIKSQVSSINSSEYIKTLENWYRSHGNNYSNRFSNLTNINLSNIHKLELAWIYNSNNGKGQNIDIQCNPIAIDGIIYTPVVGGHIVAINGYNGNEIWRSEKFNVDVARRGILFSKKNQQKIPRLYFSNGSKLIVLNATTGKRDFSFGKDGIIRTGYSKITPVIYDDKLILATWDKNLEVYNLDNGKLLWKYYFGDNKIKKFGNPEYKNNKGGNPWGGISLDEERGIVFVTTGNPSNYFDGTKRPGANHNSNSIIAISLPDQRELWSFQETIHDIWNLDLPAPPILTSIEKNDKKYDVVLTVTKRGNTLILDRLTGQPFFDMTFRQSPDSNIKNEYTSPIQLDLKIPEPFSKNTFNFEDLKNLQENFDYKTQNKLKDAKYGFFSTPDLNRDLLIYNFHGGAEWMGASVDHYNQLLFVNSNEIAWVARLLNDNANLTSQFYRLKDKNNLPGTKPPWGKITAINLKNGKIIWSKPFGNMKNISDIGKNIKKNSGTENFGGLTASDGKLIFATGTLDSKFYVFDSTNGEILFDYKLPFIGSAPPTTYLSKNEQFVVVQSTGSSSLEQGYPELNEFGDAIVAFKLKK